mmetsp:Transcript_40402/g.108428  ORF Transcript_40402/g.108428 Transcript_40402/m.108428 type:complete len:252 (-) Transcript_40402:578-1333(-)
MPRQSRGRMRTLSTGAVPRMPSRSPTSRLQHRRHVCSTTSRRTNNTQVPIYSSTFRPEVGQPRPPPPSSSPLSSSALGASPYAATPKAPTASPLTPSSGLPHPPPSDLRRSARPRPLPHQRSSSKFLTPGCMESSFNRPEFAATRRPVQRERAPSPRCRSRRLPRSHRHYPEGALADGGRCPTWGLLRRGAFSELEEEEEKEKDSIGALRLKGFDEGLYLRLKGLPRAEGFFRGMRARALTEGARGKQGHV